MEFKLNKIDMEIRQVVNESTREGKVHGYTKIDNINKYTERNNSNNNFKEQLKKRKNKKIVIEAVKLQQIKVEASKYDTIEDFTYGRFLDIKR